MEYTPAKLIPNMDFILAGNATFTIRSMETGARFTFNVRQVRPGMPHFVKVLTAPDNYTFIGTIFKGETFKHSDKSSIGQDAPSVIAFKFLLILALQNRSHSKMEFWHEGQCARCGRRLTVPESIESGFGPECVKKAKQVRPVVSHKTLALYRQGQIFSATR
jgi:hypothetical protein